MPAIAYQNNILSGLSERERRRLEHRGQIVDLQQGKWLSESGEPLSHVYFPISGVYSILGTTHSGQVEIGTVGNEGMIGISAFLDDGIGLSDVLVQIPGQALRLEKEVFQSLAMNAPSLQARLNLYTQAFLSLAIQSGACSAMHTAEQRCARWLLMMHDRVRTDRFALSQEMLARMLGVRRPTVTLATAGLKTDGAVEFKRGFVTIFSRRTLRAYSCECYGIVVAEYRRLLGPRDVPPGGETRPATSAA
jgi:CRP-like cAMP-binding protein